MKSSPFFENSNFIDFNIMSTKCHETGAGGIFQRKCHQELKSKLHV